MCLYPETDVTVYCALPDSSVTWSSGENGVKIVSRHAEKEILCPDIQLCFISIDESYQGTSQHCVNASATINSVPKTLDGLEVACATSASEGKVSKTFVIGVIGKEDC